ncbi:uncharacterized protein LOC126830287 [Patella vulgata]|uniref:uncharacterized protein LOC126830287 n=1 Tax=Patella vulgata TaxID=6465 RepID=UPI00217F887B|nr:uncharacterized protein LOC126830287 [Patella vulgata]
MKTQSSSNRDPFSRIPLPKSFYHPSQQKKLSRTDRKIALSPSKERSISPEDELFLKGSNVFSHGTPPTRDRDKSEIVHFDESWPSSERPSFSSLSGYDNNSTGSFDVTKRNTMKEGPDVINQHDSTTQTKSVLQSYINRFRHSAPTSREERNQKGVATEKDFWWLSSHPLTPTSSSTPRDDSDNGSRSRQFLDRSDKSYSAMTDYRSHQDHETQKLQEKADRILAQSESTCSVESYEAEPAISSDGLASSLSHSSTSSYEPPSRSLLSNKYTRTEPAGKPYISEKRSVPAITRPEDDILYQWRLQRKMDLSRMGAAEMIAKNKSEVSSKLKEFQQKLTTKEIPVSVHFTPNPVTRIQSYDNELPANSRLSEDPVSVSEQTKRQTVLNEPTVASPSLLYNKRSDEMVEPHLHLMCDVLPCPHAQKYQKQFQKQLSNNDIMFKEDENGFEVHPSDNVSAQYKQFLEAEKPHLERKNEKDEEKDKRNMTSPSNVEITQSVEESLDFKPTSSEQTEQTQPPEFREEFDKELQTKTVNNETRNSRSSKSASSPPNSPVIRPKYTSSPARSKGTVKTAIGQAVKDFLFTTSSSSVVSSVDSMSSMLSVIPERHREDNTYDDSLDQHDNTTNRYQEDDKNEQEDNEEEEEEYISDGEYPDDHLLLLLRQQRQNIEQKLGEIDMSLSR